LCRGKSAGYEYGEKELPSPAVARTATGLDGSGNTDQTAKIQVSTLVGKQVFFCSIFYFADLIIKIILVCGLCY
jgi:hypothetical protein